MVAITNTTSLTFLREEIDVELSQAEAALEAFVQDNNRTRELEQCTVSFSQLKGIFQVLDLPAAALMAEEMEMLASALLDSSDKADMAAALSTAVIMLGRYLEYVQLKNKPVSALLITAINEVRAASGRSLIGESHFFSVDFSQERYPPIETAGVGPGEIASLCRRLRQMYQVGLVDLLRNNSYAGLRLMERALTRLDRACGDVPLSRGIWVARAAVVAMAHDSMVLTPARRQLLAQYDRIMKSIVYEGESVIRNEAPLLLIKESVYIVSLATTAQGVVGEVKQVFGLRGGMTDAELQKEMSVMAGGGSSVLRTVAASLKDELNDLKGTLDLIAQGVADTDYSDVATAIQRMASTLSMVGASKEAQTIRERAEEVASWKADSVDIQSAEFQTLVDELLAVENAVASLEQQFSPSDDVNKEASNKGISLYQLSEARATVVSECRSGLSLVKRAVGSFMDSQWDGMHLANVPSVLAGVSGGLTFLELDRAREISDRCREFIQQGLLDSSTVPSSEQMETLADAITSVDYYLESMEEHKPIGESVLEIAETSLEELGYPVTRPVAV